MRGLVLIPLALLLAFPTAQAHDPVALVEESAQLACPGPSSLERIYCATRDFLLPPADVVGLALGFAEGTRDAALRAHDADMNATAAYRDGLAGDLAAADARAATLRTYGFADDLCMRWVVRGCHTVTIGPGE